MFDKIQSTYFKRVTTGVLALFMTASSGFSYAVPVYAEEVTTAAAKRKKEEEFSSTESSTLQLNENSTKEEVKESKEEVSTNATTEAKKLINDGIKETINKAKNQSSRPQEKISEDTDQNNSSEENSFREMIKNEKESGRKLSDQKAQENLTNIMDRKQYTFDKIVQNILEINDFSYYSKLTKDDISFLMNGTSIQDYEIVELMALKSAVFYDSCGEKKEKLKDFYSGVAKYLNLIDECKNQKKSLTRNEKQKIEDECLSIMNDFYDDEDIQWKTQKDFQDYLTANLSKNKKIYYDQMLKYIEDDELSKDKVEDMKNDQTTLKKNSDKNSSKSDKEIELPEYTEMYNQESWSNGFSIDTSELINSLRTADSVKTSGYCYLKIDETNTNFGGKGDSKIKINVSYNKSDNGNKTLTWARLRDSATTWRVSIDSSSSGLANNHGISIPNRVTTKKDDVKNSNNKYSYFVFPFQVTYKQPQYYKLCNNSEGGPTDYLDRETNNIRLNFDDYDRPNNGASSLTYGVVKSDTPRTVTYQVNAAFFGVKTYNGSYLKHPTGVLRYMRPKYRMDVNGLLDGVESGNTKDYGKFSLRINGNIESGRQNKDDIWEEFYYGTPYSIEGVSTDSDRIVYKGASQGSTSGTIWGDTTVQLKFVTCAYLDLNGVLDGSQKYDLTGFGTADIYINGNLYKPGAEDFYELFEPGTTWSVVGYAKSGYHYHQDQSVNVSGTMGSDDMGINLVYTSGSTLSIDPNGGTYKGSSGVTTVNNLSPGATITVDSPTRPGYKFGGYEKSNESYQSYASNTGWTTSHGENVGTYSRSYDGNVSLNEAPDGGYYRTNHVWRGIDSATDNYNCIAFPTYTAQAGHTYKISGEVWISERPSGGSFALNFYHGDSSNDWKHCMWGISEGWTGKWVKFSMERTFDTTTNDARFEIWTSNLKGLTGNVSFWLQGLKITDETTGNDVSMTKIAMGDSDIKLTARWIPLHSTLSYDAQGGSLSSVKSTDNPNNYKIVDNGDYFIQSGLNSSRYLHDYDCSVNNGAKVCTWQGYATNAKQCIWTFERYKDTPYYYIINKYNGKALNLSGDGPGDLSGQTVEMWTQLSAANENQSDFLWYFKDAGDGYVTIYNKYTDKALDIPNGEDNDGVKLQQYTPNGTASQKFKLLNNSSSKTIELKQDGKVKKTITVLKAGSDYIDSEGKKIEFKKHNEQYMIIRDGEYLTSTKVSSTGDGEFIYNAFYTSAMRGVTISTDKKINGQTLYLTINENNGNCKFTKEETVWRQAGMLGSEFGVFKKGDNYPKYTIANISNGPSYLSALSLREDNSNKFNSYYYTIGYDTLDQITDSDGTILSSALFDLDNDPETIANTKDNFPTREKYTDSNVYINSATPVKKGCKFLGWNTKEDGSGTSYQPGDLYDQNPDGGNVTLYAQWEKAKYTATVKLNGGSYNGSTKDFTISKYPGEEISIAAPTRSKHNFTGYKLTMDDDDSDAPTSVTQSASGFKGIMQMGNFTLTAQWTPWKHTVRYDANAKNDTSVKGIPASQSKTANVDIKLSSDIPTRNGYTFLGWNTKADGKGTAYAAGAIYKNDQNGGTVTLYAQWTPWKHVLHYNKNVPTSSTSQTVSNMPVDQTKTFGQFMAISNLVPIRKGYTFAGWYTQSNGTGTKYDPGSNYAADQNGGTVNLYAKWTPWTYNIKYDQNVKSTSSSKTVTDMPAAQTKTQEIDVTLSSMTPKRSGYTFAGWSTSANGSVEYKPGSKFTKDLDSNGASITLYAVWTPWKHTVHYNSNIPANAPTGTTTVSNMPGDQTKTFDEKLMISSNKPTRKGYNFAGWSTSANGNVVYQPGAEYKNDQNGGTVTLYAKWTAWKHTVAYDKNVPADSKKTDVKNMPGNQTKIYDQNLTLQSNVPTRVGYTFVKWTTNKDGTGTAYQPGSQYSYNRDSDGGTVTLYAVWTPWKYTVRYDKNVPADSSSQTVSNMPADQTKTEEVNLTLSSNKPTRNGYIFNGWQAQINGKAVDYQPGATLSYDPDVKGSVITLKAKWTAWKHTIHYDKNVPASSKKTNVTNMPGDQVKVFDTALSIRPMVPKRTGYTFAGWSTTANGKAEYQPGDKYNHDQNDGTVTLYAVWTPWKYKVQYDKNISADSSSQTVSNMPTDQTKTEEVDLTLSSNKPSRYGYIFNGWQAQINGKAVDYQPGAKLSYDVDDKDGSTIILKAQWTAWKHTVHYDKNVPANSSSQTVTNMPEDQTKTFDEKLNLSTKIPKREGYNFRGWLLEYGTAIAVVSPGTAYERDQNGGTYVLKAQWEPWKHTVHYDANGGDQSSVPNDQKKTYEQNMNVATKVPTRNEYKFLGWKAYHEYKDKNGDKHSELIGDYQPGASYNYDIDETGQYAADNGEYNKCGTVTMKAQWVQLYTVKYDGNQPAIKGVTVTGSVANQTQGQDESVNLRTNNFKNDSGVYKDWSVGKDAYKYGKRNNQFKQYIHPEGFNTNHSKMKEEDTGYNRLASVEGSMVQN